MPGEGEPVDDDDVSLLGSSGMDETDARMVGDNRGSGSGDEVEFDISDHLRDEEDAVPSGAMPDETIREVQLLNDEIRSYLKEGGPTGAGVVDPVEVDGAYTPFDMNKDHMGTDDLSANWYRSPGRPVGTEGDPFRSEDPYAQLGFHPPTDGTTPPGASGDDNPLRVPPIWQLSAGSDTSKVLGADVKPDTGGEESGDEQEEESQTGTGEGEEPDSGIAGDETERQEQIGSRPGDRRH